MKVIDLLNKIANGEEVPRKIKIDDVVYELTPNKNDYCSKSYDWLTNYISSLGTLNDEVEIIEEDKKIEKLDVALLGQCDNWLRCPTNKVTKQDIELNPYIIDTIRENTLGFQHKINEIIDAINELKGKSE